MERGILRTFKPDGTPVEIYDAEALTKAEFTAFNTYSTDEVNTGMKWVDGKTIYSLVVNVGTLPNATVKVIPINASGIKEIIQLCGFAWRNVGNYISITLPRTNSNTNTNEAIDVHFNFDTNTINVQSSYNYDSFPNAYIILYYTKIN